MGADLLLGDPRGWPHPVRLIGLAVERGQRWIWARKLSPALERLAGLLLWLAIVGGTWGLAWAGLAGAKALAAPLAWLVGGWMVFTSLSLKDLLSHLEPIRAALGRNDLQEARTKLALVVGRETGSLDRTGIVRAALETLAENLSDGVIAPLFFILLAGPAGGLAYKAVNTLDSMVGYKHPPFTHLGFFPARLDDVFNFIPARLTFLFLAVGSLGLGLNPGRACRVALAEHGRTTSPNAGWPEAALAGALGVSLLGPATYAGQKVDKPYLYQEGQEPGLDDLKKGMKLTWTAGLLAYGLATGVAVLAFGPHELGLFSA